MDTEIDLKHEAYLSELIISRFGAESFSPGLERTESLYRDLVSKLKSKNIKFVTIAGTNGKGQTAHTLLYLLNQAKLGVALWSSPHILSIRERFCFSRNGKIENISYDELISSILESIEIIDRDFSELKISYYEFLFFVFLRESSKKINQNEFIILEVGIGGRLDAVNHIDPTLTCITSISRDHQSILGNSYKSILTEKLGITREGVPLFTNLKLNYLNTITLKHCFDLNIPLCPIKDNSTFSYFEANKVMALKIAQYFLPIFKFDIKLTPIFKGRFEIQKFKQGHFTFNGAHNVDGMRKLSEIIFKHFGQPLYDVIWVSFSNREIKEIETMLKILLLAIKNKGKINVTTFNHPKAMDKSSLKKLVDDIKLKSNGNLEFVESWQNSISECSGQEVLVCGSYYFIGEVQKFMVATSN